MDVMHDTPKKQSYSDYIKERQKKYDKATKKKPDSKFDKFRKGLARKLGSTRKK